MLVDTIREWELPVKVVELTPSSLAIKWRLKSVSSIEGIVVFLGTLFEVGKSSQLPEMWGILGQDISGSTT